MKGKITLFLLAGMVSLLIAGCAGTKDTVKTAPDTTSRPREYEETINPKRPKSEAPGEVMILKMRPDSIKIEKKEQTLFLIYDPSHKCFFMTPHRALYEKLKDWLPEDIMPGSQNCVVLVGTEVDLLTWVSRKEIMENQIINRVITINGLKVYEITSYLHCPHGVPENIMNDFLKPNQSFEQKQATEQKLLNQNPEIQNPNLKTPSPQSSTGNGRKVYKN